ncbi:MAG: polysaccharide biosynthesis tyrosine autokinase [Candidatus Korobacteraceae bacterium]
MNPKNIGGTAERSQLPAADRGASLATFRALPAMEASMASAQDYVSLATYWHTLLKRRWTIATVAVVVTTIAAIVSFRMQPIYKATARVQVESETPLIQSIEEMFQKSEADDTFVQTQIQVLKSENLAWRTIEQLGLTQRLISPRKLAKIPPDTRKVRLINAFKKRLTVELTPKTRMLAVSFEDPDPQLAARVSTSLVNNYIDYNFRQKYDATRQASTWMEQQLDELKAKVESSQQALVEYERQNQIVNTGEKGTIQEQMLSDLSRDLSTAESDRLQKESLYRQVLSNPQQLATLVHDDLLQKLEERSADLQDQYTATVAQYGPNFPKALRFKDEVDGVKEQIATEQARVLERIRRDYSAAIMREKLAAGAVAMQKEAVGAQSQLLIQHNILERDFEGNQQLYQSLLQRLKNATVSAGLQSTNIHLVDAALPPVEPVRPRKALNISLAFLAGVVLGIMGAFAQEGLDHSIKSAEEVESMLMAPALAVVPLQRSTQPMRWTLPMKMRLGIDSRSSATTGVGLAITETPQSVVAEAFRALRTSILLSLTPNPPKTLLITSPQAGEGKTATALNLGQSLAQRKGRILIVDADLRKGGIAKTLGLENKKGMSTVLTGSDALDDAIQQYGPQPNLWVLPSGPVPSNPAELLSSDAMTTLCAELTSRFEHIVVDSPPVLAVTDATIMAGLVDGVVLVAESGRTHRAGLMRTRAILENAGGRILGVVLNKLDLRREGYYGYGYYYYPRYGKYPYGRAASE